MDDFLVKIRELPEFAGVPNLVEFELLFEILYKKKCGKCKFHHFNYNYSNKKDGPAFKLCNKCRLEMVKYMRDRKKSNKGSLKVQPSLSA